VDGDDATRVSGDFLAAFRDQAVIEVDWLDAALFCTDRRDATRRR
jgi:hypothetical protein